MEQALYNEHHLDQIRNTKPLCAPNRKQIYDVIRIFMVTIQHNNMKLEIKLGEIIPVQCVTHMLHSLTTLPFASRQTTRRKII